MEHDERHPQRAWIRIGREIRTWVHGIEKYELTNITKKEKKRSLWARLSVIECNGDGGFGPHETAWYLLGDKRFCTRAVGSKLSAYAYVCVRMYVCLCGMPMWHVHVAYMYVRESHVCM